MAQRDLSPDDVPAHRELIEAGRRWVLWKLTTPPGRSAPTKVPFTSGGSQASTTSSKSWAPYEAVKARFDAQPDAYQGLGFVFVRSGDPGHPGIVGIDLDKCRDPETGLIADWAVDVLDRFRSYSEVTPSGAGIHILCKGLLPRKGARKGQVECYAAERFFTVTGDYLDSYPDEIVDAQEGLDWLWTTYLDRGDGSDAGDGIGPVHGDGHLPEGIVFPIAKHEALLENDPEYARTWKRKRKNLADQSLSSYDMALAVRTAMVNWTEGEIIALIKAFRQVQGETEKANRTDYLLRTARQAIAWVAQGGSDSGKGNDFVAAIREKEAADSLGPAPAATAAPAPAPPQAASGGGGEAPPQPPSGPPHDDDPPDDPEPREEPSGFDAIPEEAKTNARAIIKARIGVEVDRLIQIGIEPAMFFLRLRSGVDVQIGRIGNLMAHKAFQSVMAAQQGIIVNSCKQMVWETVLKALMVVRELRAAEAIAFEPEMRDLTIEYLTDHRALAIESLTGNKTKAEIVQTRSPFLENGLLHLHLDDILRMLAAKGVPPDTYNIRGYLVLKGYRRVTVATKTTSRSYWAGKPDQITAGRPLPGHEPEEKPPF